MRVNAISNTGLNNLDRIDHLESMGFIQNNELEKMNFVKSNQLEKMGLIEKPFNVSYVNDEHGANFDTMA